MKKYNAVCWLIICLLITSCSSSTPAPINTIESTIIPAESQPPNTRSFPSRWDMVDQSHPSDNRFPIFIYGMKLTGHNTIVISSVGSDMLNQLDQQDFTILLRDNNGDANLRSKNTLASLGNDNILVMEFEARNRGASEISLVAGLNNSSANFPRQIVKFVEPPEDPDVFTRRAYLISAFQAFENNGYRILFEGWGPSPSSVTPSTVELPESVTVLDEATLRIENLSNGKKEYLLIQFLSNGEITSELIQ